MISIIILPRSTIYQMCLLVTVSSHGMLAISFSASLPREQTVSESPKLVISISVVSGFNRLLYGR